MFAKNSRERVSVLKLKLYICDLFLKCYVLSNYWPGGTDRVGKCKVLKGKVRYC